MSLFDYPKSSRVKVFDEHYFILVMDRVRKVTAEGVSKMLEEKEDRITRVIKYSDVPDHEYAVYEIPR